MGYKREARVLFVSGGIGGDALMAAGFADALGAGWLCGRAAVLAAPCPNPLAIRVMLESGIDISGLRLQPLEGTLLRWADLVVTLDAAARVRCPPVPVGVRRRHDPLSDAVATGAGGVLALDGYRRLRERIRCRVEGMVGGMRMLQRSATD